MAIAAHLVCVGIKHVFGIPMGKVGDWLSEHLTDHSLPLPKAVAAANDRAWKAVALALAGDTVLGRIAARFRSADFRAVRDQIRLFVAEADFVGQPEGLRERASNELDRLQREGRIGGEVIELQNVDLTRFADTGKIADDSIIAVKRIADELASDAPNLGRVLMLAQPGGTPLLVAAFTYFLWQEVRKTPGLLATLTVEQVKSLSDAQRKAFEDLERSVAGRFDQFECVYAG